MNKKEYLVVNEVNGIYDNLANKEIPIKDGKHYVNRFGFITYSSIEEIKPYEYPFEVFEVVCLDKDKHEIIIIKKIDHSEVDKYCENNKDSMVKSDNPLIRSNAALRGYSLDILIYDENPDVRISVAKVGYGLSKLTRDKDPMVRKAVAEYGYGLGKLINDESALVRMEVASKGYGPEQLVNDKAWTVREEVAKNAPYDIAMRLVDDESEDVRATLADRGLARDILINDESALVRQSVALTGYGIGTLLQDPSKNVRQSAIEYVINSVKDDADMVSWIKLLLK